MIQDSRITQALAQAQETHADTARHVQYAYRIHVAHVRPNKPHDDSGVSTVRESIAAIVARFVKGATLIPTIGLWDGVIEHSTIVEVVALGSDRARIRDIASALRRAFLQSCVLVTYAPVQVEWIRD